MRTSVSPNDPLVEARYASWYKMIVDLVQPKNFYGVAGRATAKTSDIIAERSMDIIHDMPGAYFAWVADTYMNAFDNVVPTLLEGWERKGWIEGVHYVTDERPPSNFKLPHKPVQSYKHTISVWNGCFFKIVSMDQPSSSAGNSYQHLFGDEVKYLNYDKLKKLTPAIRGEYVGFGHSVFYRGRTFTTDMPNLADKEFDWILDQEKYMDKEQIRMILEISIELNKIKKEFFRAYKFKDKAKIERVGRRLTKCTENWVRARKDSTLFMMTSTFANADILTEGYFKDSLESDGIEGFKTAILTLRPTIKKGERFYTHLGEHHYLDNAVDEKFYDNVPLTQRIDPTSAALKFCKAHEKLEIGVDFGDMCSLVSAQQHGKYIYLLKNFYTLAPESSAELASAFRAFYAPHKNKVVDMYYDRSGNQNSQTGRDWASDLKYHIEHENDKPTGWRVNLMSRNQRTILQSEEYFFMKNLLGGTVPGLPEVRIDKILNKELKSSLELTKTTVKKDRKGSTVIGKDKSSEALPLHSRPMYSTNFSDAFKYLLCRIDWLKLSARKSSTSISLDESLINWDEM